MRFHALVACGVIALIAAGHLWFADSASADGGLLGGGVEFATIPEPAPAVGTGQLAGPPIGQVAELPGQAAPVLAELSPVADSATDTLSAAPAAVLDSASDTVEALAHAIPALEPVAEIALPVIDIVDETLDGVTPPTIPGLAVSPLAPIAETVAAGSGADTSTGPDRQPAVRVATVVINIPPASGEVVTTTAPAIADEPGTPTRLALEVDQASHGTTRADAMAAPASLTAARADVATGEGAAGGGSRIPLPEPPSAGACIAALAVLGAGALLARPRSGADAMPLSRVCMPTAPPG